MVIHRGDIYYADLSPAIGEEQGGMRPVIILQGDALNDAVYATNLETVTIAPITTGNCPGMDPQWVVDLPGDGSIDSMLLFEHKIIVAQPRAISVRRLLEFVGKAGPEVMAEVDQKLKFVLGL